MIVDKVWKLTNTVRPGLDWILGPHTQRDSPLSRVMCDPIAPPVTVCYTMKICVFMVCLLTTFCLFFWRKKIPSVAKMVKSMEKRIRERVSKEKGEGLSRMIQTGNLWVTRLRPCVDNVTSGENFPCHQHMSVSNLYVRTSGRTWRICGSQIWVRTGRDSILCRVCWTHTQKCSRSVTKSTSPRRWPRLSFNGLEKNLRTAYSGRSERLGWTSQSQTS